MGKQRNDGLLYLQDYPQLRRWMNQCVACQRLGYKTELPEKLGTGVAAQNLRQFFPEMGVDAEGFCEQCAVAVRTRKA